MVLKLFEVNSVRFGVFALVVLHDRVEDGDQPLIALLLVLLKKRVLNIIAIDFLLIFVNYALKIEPSLVNALEVLLDVAEHSLCVIPFCHNSREGSVDLLELGGESTINLVKSLKVVFEFLCQLFSIVDNLLDV